jgi:hypothetical protein
MITLASQNAAAGGTALSAWLETLIRALARSRRINAARTALPEGAAALLARADAYEATQPGFAADLRASAHRLIEAR